jgi:carbonic anhydrase/acetyltransferase-like protein (isoleucine patch superfamily)
MIQSYLGMLPKVDPDAWVHETAVLIGQVTVGPETTIWPHTTLRADDGPIRIGARSSIQDGTVVHCTEDLSETVVGDQVTVGHNVTLHGARVADNCIIGMGSTLLDNAEVGELCIVGAHSLLTQNVKIPPYSLVLGAPAKVVRRLTDKELDWIAYSWRRYVEQGRIYRSA